MPPSPKMVGSWDQADGEKDHVHGNSKRAVSSTEMKQGNAMFLFFFSHHFSFRLRIAIAMIMAHADCTRHTALARGSDALCRYAACLYY